VNPRPVVNRTVRIERRATGRGGRVTRVDCDCITVPVPPTAEQMRDDGSLDGVPVISIEQLAQRAAQRLREIAELCSEEIARQAPRRHDVNGVRVRVVPAETPDAAGDEFISIKQAAASLNVPISTARFGVNTGQAVHGLLFLRISQLKQHG
jgi:hypothetical protein